jgi:hypothetical protein
VGNKEAVASIMVQAQERAENLPTIISDVRSAGHTTGLRRSRDNHTSQEDGGAPSARRVEWITDLGVEEPIRGDEQRIGPFADEGRARCRRRGHGAAAPELSPQAEGL